MARIVIALGGNALGDTPAKQLDLVKQTAKPIVDLIEAGNQVVITHGNGPQVGMINLGMRTAAEVGAVQSDMPFPECGAMSQGYIGYHLQNSIENELSARGITRNVAAVVPQVLVDAKDPAFEQPTKPVGAFYNSEAAQRLIAEKGYTMIDDAGRGYRRVVPSPRPVDIVEKEVVNTLVDSGCVVIAAGGGGIPVTKQDTCLVGVSAVVDKDFAAAKLAELIAADLLILLTAVDRVAINWGQPNQKALENITVAEAEQYCREGHFAPGSMLPKVEAAISFARTGGEAVIASLERAAVALHGESGTRIHR